MLKVTTPGIMYSSVMVTVFILYHLLWKQLPWLYEAYNAFYNRVFPDAGEYYILLIVSCIIILLVSGILFVGLTIKIAQLLGDVFL